MRLTTLPTGELPSSRLFRRPPVAMIRVLLFLTNTPEKLDLQVGTSRGRTGLPVAVRFWHNHSQCLHRVIGDRTRRSNNQASKVHGCRMWLAHERSRSPAVPNCQSPKVAKAEGRRHSIARVGPTAPFTYDGAGGGRRCASIHCFR